MSTFPSKTSYWFLESYIYHIYKYSIYYLNGTVLLRLKNLIYSDSVFDQPVNPQNNFQGPIPPVVLLVGIAMWMNRSKRLGVSKINLRRNVSNRDHQAVNIAIFFAGWWLQHLSNILDLRPQHVHGMNTVIKLKRHFDAFWGLVAQPQCSFENFTSSFGINMWLLLLPIQCSWKVRLFLSFLCHMSIMWQTSSGYSDNAVGNCQNCTECHMDPGSNLWSLTATDSMFNCSTGCTGDSFTLLSLDFPTFLGWF